MSLFNLPVEGSKKPKPTSVHPWSKTIKDEYSPFIKPCHNSVRNVRYPKPKEKKVSAKQYHFTVIGNRVTKEFIYCVNLVQGMHKYRPRKFSPPVIRGVTGVEWESNTLRDLQAQYGNLSYCLQSQVAVICNGEFIGGEKELKEVIETKYYINLLALDYQRESIKAFAKYLKEIGRPVAYMHITINEKPIGSLMFMLYSDIVPRTCENFLRLCTTKKGGYAGTPVHRIVKDGWIQCGGFGLKNTDMDCENFIANFDRRGVLGMANAGRHSDCSTQFFVLLQPNACFKLRFVAFGQLIDGAETLKKIEAVETYYEAPLDEIIIATAGIVNLECQDIRINKDAREYIDKHIDDLVIIGEMFYAELLEKVFVEAELRRLDRLNPPSPEGEELVEEAFGKYVDDAGNYIPENIRATRRFIRKKSEIQKANAEKNEQERSAAKAKVQPNEKPKDGIPDKTEGGENMDFDVEDYDPEEYVYSQISGPSVSKKATRPYYLALTDVPYPGEVNSNFDLRRFLQGDYCLETDLDMKDSALNRDRNKVLRDQKMQAVSQIIRSYGNDKWGDDSSESEDESTSSGEIDSDEERDIKEYLQKYGEKVSFSGHVTKSISKKYVTRNPVQDKRSCEAWNDEEIRRMRLAVQDIERRLKKKVSLQVEPWETHTKIKRRQTGYVQTTHVSDTDIDDEEVEDIKIEPPLQDRKVSVSIYAPLKGNQHKIHRRQTGFVPPNILAKLAADEEEDRVDYSERKSNVRIAPKELNTQRIFKSLSSDRTARGHSPDADVQKTRPSVLMRLYDDIAMDDRGPTPTLKDYKPMSAMHKKTFTLAEDLADNLFLRRSMNVFQKQLNFGKSSITSDIELPATRGRRSMDKRETIDYSNRPWAEVLSIKSVEYSRKRPSISVSAYQTKNKLEMEALAKKIKDEEKAIAKKLKEAEKKTKKEDTKKKDKPIEFCKVTPYRRHVWQWIIPQLQVISYY